MLERHSALAGHYPEGDHGPVFEEGPGLVLCERRGLALFQIDGPAGDAAFLSAVREALGFDLPGDPGTSTGAGAAAALWTGPGRWTVRTPETAIADLEPKLRAALEGRHGALIELGQARSVIRVAGRNARACLGKGTTIDLHPRAFPVGACATTQLAVVTAQIHHAEEGVYDVAAYRSFGLHLWEWLGEVGAEYGIRVLPVMQG